MRVSIYDHIPLNEQGKCTLSIYIYIYVCVCV